MPHPQSKRAKAAKVKRAEERKRTTPEERRGAQVAAVERRRVVAQDRQRRRTIRRIRSGLIGVLATVAVVLGLWWAFRPPPELEGVERPPNLGRGHVSNATYSDEAPTSGAHSSRSPVCGTYPSPLSLDLAVHALEHGTVVLWYRADRLDLGADLVSATSAWDSHVIISPSASLDSPIVATAWNRRKVFDQAGEDLTDFVDTYRRRGPESLPCER